MLGSPAVRYDSTSTRSAGPANASLELQDGSAPGWSSNRIVRSGEASTTQAAPAFRRRAESFCGGSGSVNSLECFTTATRTPRERSSSTSLTSSVVFPTPESPTKLMAGGSDTRAAYRHRSPS